MFEINGRIMRVNPVNSIPLTILSYIFQYIIGLIPLKIGHMSVDFFSSLLWSIHKLVVDIEKRF